MVLLSIFFTRIESTEDHQRIVLYSFVWLHALALHLAVKILLNLSVHEFEHCAICQLYFPPECQQDRTLLRNQYY